MALADEYKIEMLVAREVFEVRLAILAPARPIRL